MYEEYKPSFEKKSERKGSQKGFEKAIMLSETRDLDKLGRIAVEGRFEGAKRRYGLERIKSKLQESNCAAENLFPANPNYCPPFQ